MNIVPFTSTMTQIIHDSGCLFQQFNHEEIKLQTNKKLRIRVMPTYMMILLIGVSLDDM